MDPLEHEDIKTILALVRENNLMLHKMKRDAAWAKFWGVIKIIIFIVPFIYAYYFLSPYIEKVNSMYQKTENVKNFDVQTYLKSLINQETNSTKK